jgi:hypothetical protein
MITQTKPTERTAQRDTLNIFYPMYKGAISVSVLLPNNNINLLQEQESSVIVQDYVINLNQKDKKINFSKRFTRGLNKLNIKFHIGGFQLTYNNQQVESDTGQGTIIIIILNQKPYSITNTNYQINNKIVCKNNPSCLKGEVGNKQLISYLKE